MTNNFIRHYRQSTAADFVAALLNEPWRRDGLHCWSLVCRTQISLFGRTMPDLPAAPLGRKASALAFASHGERNRWMRRIAPEHGAIALMRRQAAQSGFYIHAGVYLDIDGGGVLHTDDPHGVVFDSLLELKARGWMPDYFVPIEAPSCME